jgi:hypothetical protein
MQKKKNFILHDLQQGERTSKEFYMNNNHIHNYEHEFPIWKDKADSVVIVKTSESDEQAWEEKLPARKLKDTQNLYEICALPFYTYDVCLGDTVRVDKDKNILEVVESPMRYGFRVYIKPESPDNTYEKVNEELSKHKCNIEINTPTFFGVDVENEEIASHISGILQNYEDKGVLEYETVRS